MFVLTHSIRAILLTACAILIVTALPLDARSQAVSESENTAVPQPYAIEGIPGGQAIVGDFVVGPGKVDLTLKPGQSKIEYMTVTNRTGERRRFNITVEDARGSDNPETPIELLGDDRGPYSLRDYISVPAESFELGHNERARIPVTITVPQNTEPGGKYGSVLIDTVALESNVGDTGAAVPQSAIIARIGTLFFVTIPGDIERGGKLVEFGTIGSKHVYGSGPIPLGILIENTGSIHIAPSGEVRITNMMGDEVGVVSLEPWFILPLSARLREISWDREFLFGRYIATAEINMGYDNVKETAIFAFWVLPWKTLAIGFGAIFIVLFIIRAFFRTFEFKRKS